MRSVSLRLPFLCALLAALVASVTVSAGPALAACDASAPAASPVVRPDTPYEVFKPGDPARFSGTVQVDCGWRYRQFGQPTGQAFIQYLSADGATLYGESDVTQQVLVAEDGSITGTANTIFSGERARAERLRLRMRLTGGPGGTAEVVSPAVPVDGTPPAIRSYALTSPNTVQVDFSEPVTVAGGDRITDWRIDDQRPVEVTGSGATRVLRTSRTYDQDATPEVFYRPFDPLDPNRQEYVDRAGNTLTDENRIATADDRIPPAVPSIPSIEGRSTSGGVVVGGSRQPTVAIADVRAGHRVQLWRDGLQDDTRVFDPPGSSGTSPDVLMAEVVVPEGATSVTVTAEDYASALPDQALTHTFYARAIDAAGNVSADVGRADYRFDPDAPRALTAVGDGRFVTVRFSEPVTGTNRPEDWRVTSGGPVEAVSGSGDYRVIRTASPASGRITWTRPNAEGVTPYQDASGNVLQPVDLPIVTAGQLQVSDAAVSEGSPVVFTVTVARPQGNTTTYAVDYATEDGSAKAGEDYTATSGRLAFTGDETTKTVSVPTAKDDRTESAETFTLRLSNPGGGATLPSPATATGRITEAGAVPGISIFDSRAHEGTTSRATVQLSAPSSTEVTVRWATVEGTASAADYRAGSGTLRFPAGTREQTIVIPLVDDGADEPTETFAIRLADPVNATLARDQATVSVLDGLGVAPGIGRVDGPSRVETSAAISKAFYAAADTVVIATANAYPDALAGAPLAQKADAPILLTTRERLHPAASAEVKRLGARTAFVLGGPAALSSQVDRDLRAAGVTTVRRFAGVNRFDTARLIASEVGGDATYVVEGANANPKRGWPDAVAVSALAASQQRPILLVERDRLPGETARALDALEPSRATIVGGPAAVSDAVARAVDARSGDVDRVAGRTRYETSRAVASRAVATGLSPANTFFATGDDWPDSLSASPAVARTGGVLLLVDSDRLDDSPPAREWLETHRERLRSITLVGGPKAISAGVADQIRRVSGLRPR